MSPDEGPPSEAPEGPPPIAAASVPPATDKALKAPETTPAEEEGTEIIDITAEETETIVVKPHEAFIDEITARESSETDRDFHVISTKFIPVTRDEILKIMNPIEHEWTMPDWVLVIEREIDAKYGPLPEDELYIDAEDEDAEEEAINEPDSIRTRLADLASRIWNSLPQIRSHNEDEKQPSTIIMRSAVGLIDLEADKADMAKHMEICPGTLQMEFAQQVLGVLYAKMGDYSELSATAAGVDFLRFKTMGKIGQVLMAEIQPGPSKLDSKGRGIITGSAVITNLTKPQRYPSTAKRLILQVLNTRTLKRVIERLQTD